MPPVISGACSNLLETGDPLELVNFPVTAGGFTYHLQDAAIFSYFARQSPSAGYQGRYTFLGTFPATPRPADRLARVIGAVMAWRRGGMRTWKRSPGLKKGELVRPSPLPRLPVWLPSRLRRANLQVRVTAYGDPLPARLSQFCG